MGGLLFGAAQAQNIGLFASTSNVANYGMTSPDGATFTDRTIASGAVDVAWNGTVFCALIGTRTSYTSTDGITWTSHATALPNSGGNNWNKIRWGNGVFLAFQSTTATTAAATSPDGVTWTARTMPSSQNWRDAIWNGFVWVAVNSSALTSLNCSAYSSDNATWARGNLTNSTTGIYTVGWNGTVFTANGRFNDFYYGYDGVNWNTNYGVVGLSGRTPLEKTLYNGTVLVMIAGNDGYYGVSSDGIAWTFGLLPAGTQVIRDNFAWNGSTFCLLGNIGGTTYPFTSSNGIDWTKGGGTPQTPVTQGGMTASYLQWGTY